LERENFARCSHLIRFEDAELSLFEVELNCAIAKEVPPSKRPPALTGEAEFAQVNCYIVGGKWDVASADGDTS